MRFGGLVAVNELDLAIAPGQLYGLIGPNGAGKTTVFNVVTGVYTLTSGQILFEGAAIGRARRAFGTWREIAPGDRARLLRRFADAVDSDREHLAQLEVANSGHTIGNARWEAGNARHVMANYASAHDRLLGKEGP